MKRPRENRLIRLLADDADLTRREAVQLLDALITRVLEADRLNVPGLGVFRRSSRKARRLINPQTGEAMFLPATITIAFRPAARVRRQLNRRGP